MGKAIMDRPQTNEESASAVVASDSAATNSNLTSRPPRHCDVCVAEQAKLYCAADDAYLCSSCDIEVHSANSLARRHERVRLGSNGAPMKIDRKGGGDSMKVKKEETTAPSTISTNSGSSASRKKSKGFRGNNQAGVISSRSSSSQADPVPADKTERGETSMLNLCITGVDSEIEKGKDADSGFVSITGQHSPRLVGEAEKACNENAFPDPFGWEQCGAAYEDGTAFLGNQENYEEFTSQTLERFSDQQAAGYDMYAEAKYDDELERSTFVGNSAVTVADMNMNAVKESHMTYMEPEPCQNRKIESDLHGACSHLNLFGDLDGFNSKMLFGSPSLTLDRDSVLIEWSDRAPVWLEENSQLQGSLAAEVKLEKDDRNDQCSRPARRAADLEEDRRARVMRYRERKKSRLFSKKVRYEVRKVNAENRPRIKGRFVKREQVN